MNESVVFGISQSTLTPRSVSSFSMFPLIGLDAVFPAILIALIFPALRKRRTLIPASGGALLSILATPFVPAGMPVLFSLLGLLTWRMRK